MFDLFYPDNPSLALKVIADNLARDPSYLAQSDYPLEDQKFLLSLLSVARFAADADESKGLVFGMHGDKYETISAEAMALYNEMATFRATSEFKNATVSEKNSLLRTMTTLLDKLVSIDERAKGLKHLSDFQNTILDIIEDVMNPDQRTTIMERLKAVRQDEPRENELAIEQLTGASNDE